jgi:hypothetical protein
VTSAPFQMQMVPAAAVDTKTADASH